MRYRARTLIYVVFVTSFVVAKGRLLFQLPRKKLTSLFEAELLLAFPRGDAVKIDTGLWAVESSDTSIDLIKGRLKSDLDFVESAYRQISPICASPEELVIETGRLALHRHDWRITSMCISPYHMENKGFSAGQQFAKSRQIDSRMLQCALAQKIQGQPSLVLQDKNKYDVATPNLTLTVLEFHRGFILAEEVYRRSDPVGQAWSELVRIWRRRPYNFSAALNPDIAKAAVQVAIKMRGGEGLTLLDPCCGSGTSAFVAATHHGSAISHVFGCDISSERVSGAEQNWQYLKNKLGETFLPSIRFEQLDATQAITSSNCRSLQADIVLCNPPWGVNHSQAYHQDREAIVRQLAASQGELLKTGAVAAFITNGASRVPNKIYKEAGWTVDQTVRVAADPGSAASDKDIFVTFCVLST